jgi:quercetin dioxygenase-like cupin family protein
MLRRKIMSTEKSKTLWPDPADVAADVYTILMENDRVRVFDVRFKPGQKTVMHGHPDHVAYVFTPFTLNLKFPDGNSQDIPLNAGQVLWIGAGPHAAQNVGTTDGSVLVIELKEPQK